MFNRCTPPVDVLPPPMPNYDFSLTRSHYNKYEQQEEKTTEYEHILYNSGYSLLSCKMVSTVKAPVFGTLNSAISNFHT